MMREPERWRPNVTVAAVVPQGDRFLMVEERDRQTGELVINQPAGHLEAEESLVAAVEREVLEETRWQVSVTGYLGVGRFVAPNGVTYLRHTFVARPVEEIRSQHLDDGIIAAHWMNEAEVRSRSAQLRSPLALAVIEQYRQGLTAPLSLVIDT